MIISSLAAIPCNGFPQEGGEPVTLVLREADVRELLTYSDAIECIRQVARAEYLGNTEMPSRHNLSTSRGWFRVMPAAIRNTEGMNIYGLKVMNLTAGKGLRYVIHLYSGDTGELLCIMDAATITQIRTGSATALAGTLLTAKREVSVGLIGSGFEARGQLSALSQVFSITECKVYSPNAGNRLRFADEMSSKTGIPITPVASAEDAVRGMEVVVLATKSTDPVISGEWIARGATVLSIGSTRLDLRELDDKTLERAAGLLVDHCEQVCAESADVKSALDRGLLSKDDITELSVAVGTGTQVRTSEEDILVYKSVGTALQDLAVAYHVFTTAQLRQMGSQLDEFPYLKKQG